MTQANGTAANAPPSFFEMRKKSANGPVWFGLDLQTDGPNNLAAAAAPFSNANLHAGAWPGSVGLDSEGHLWINGVQKRPFGSWEEELEVGEFLVLGCGLVPSADGFELFFTRNGKLLGLETLTMEEDQPQPSTVYPMVSLSTHGTIVEANFGGDCPAKKFHYNPSNHEMEKKIREALLVATQELVHLETTMAEEKVQMRNELHTVKGEMEKRLELLEILQEQKKRLREWLCDGAGQLRNVTLLRVPNQQLDTSTDWRIETNSGGLKAKRTGGGYFWVRVRAVKPFPLGIARLEDKFLHYFEVTVTGMGRYYNLFIGLCVIDCPLFWLYIRGDTTGSFSIGKDGDYWGSGTSQQSGTSRGPFVNGDVIGCGVLVLPTERRLFFTKNGVIWVKPILLGAEDAKTNLYPFANAHRTDDDTEVEFNFGGDLASKPFKYALSHLSVVDV